MWYVSSQRILLSVVMLALTYAPAVHAFNFNLSTFVKSIYEDNTYYGDNFNGNFTGTSSCIPASPCPINTLETYLTASASAGATTLTVNSSQARHGDEILIIQMEGADAGKFEFNKVSYWNTTTMNLLWPTKNAYTYTDKIQVIAMKRYRDLSLASGDYLTPSAYSSGTGAGGVAAILVSGTLTLNDAGGGSVKSAITTGGGYTTYTTPRGFTGGTDATGSGPGGGSGASAAGGTNTSPGSSSRAIMGSGGGGSTSGGVDVGGRGGGIVFIKAKNIVLNGDIKADGRVGTGTNAGGGSGGTIYISTDSLTTSSSCGSITAVGGAGLGTGTAGGNGRIFINWTNTLSCTTGTSGITTYQKIRMGAESICRIVLTTLGGDTWTVPADFNSSSNYVETYGAGGGGSNGGMSNGGGGGGYSRTANISLTPGNTVSYWVGTGGAGGAAHASTNNGGATGGDTYFCNSTSNCLSIAGSAVEVGAKGGAGGAAGTRTGGAGGASASGVGTYKFSGGAGGAGVGTAFGGGGGGGAGGVINNGYAGTSPPGGANNGASGNYGGNYNTISGIYGLGSTTSASPGENGGAGTEFLTYPAGTYSGSGAGGGGGYGSAAASAGGNGGSYGGGGGGGGYSGSNKAAGGNGAQGVIQITYRGKNCQ